MTKLEQIEAYLKHIDINFKSLSMDVKRPEITQPTQESMTEKVDIIKQSLEEALTLVEGDND